MSARERAKTAVAQAWNGGNAFPTEAADAASDIWEPIVRDLVRALDSAKIKGAIGADILRQAKQALDES